MAEQGTTNLPGREEVGLTGDEQLGPDEYLRIIETVAQSKGIQGLGIGRLITPGGRIARTGYFAPDGSGHSTPTERMTITRW